MDPFSAKPQLILFCDIIEPSTGQLYSRDPRGTAKRAEAYLKSTGIGDTAFFGPEAEFFVFDSVKFGTGGNFGIYQLDSIEGPGANLKDYPEGNMGHRPGVKGGYFPVPPVDSEQRPARRDALDHGRDGPADREAPPRGGAVAARARHQVRHAGAAGRLHADLQVLRPQRRPQLRQDRDLHAEADLRRQRLGHARPPVDLEGRQAAVRRQRLCRPVGDGALLHRRHHQARQGAERLHQPADQLLQAPDPGLRGAGAAGLFGPQPLGLLPHPLRDQPEGQARRGPLPGSGREPLPGLRARC